MTYQRPEWLEDRDPLIPVCWALGNAAGKLGAAPDTDMIEEPTWQRAYMRGYERGQREKRRKEISK